MAVDEPKATPTRQRADDGWSRSEAAPFIPWPEQNEDGVDITLIRASLYLSPVERLREADRTQRDVERLHAVARRFSPNHAA